MVIKTIIYICLFVPFLSLGQNQSSIFKHLSMEDGLSQTSISCIVKDSRGFMWFGTEDGLNKYDGTSFTIYRHKPDDESSLSSSYINAIVEDRDGFLWIGTKNGLNYYDPNTETFKRYYHDPRDKQSLSHNDIFTLLKSNDDRLIIGTSKGVNVYYEKGTFLRYISKDTIPFANYNLSIVQDHLNNLWVLTPKMLKKIKLNESSFDILYRKPLDNSIKYTMYADSTNLWVGTGNGLLKLNLKSKTTKTFKFYGSNLKTDKRNCVLSIIDKEDGELILGTLEGGLVNFNKSTSEFKIIKHIPFNKLSLNSNSIRSLFLDQMRILWIGTFGGGVNKYDPNQIEFEHYTYLPNNKISLSENTVRSILKDKDGELWVGTHNGLNRINRNGEDVEVYRYNPHKSSTISSNTVRALKEDSKGTIWAGTWSNGLNSFDKNSGKYKRYIKIPGTFDSITAVRALEIDSKDNIWIGGNGLRQYNPTINEYKNYFFSTKNDRVSEYSIHSLFFDNDESLWIGTYQNGLINLDIKSDRVKTYSHNPKDSTSISHNYITSITEDKNGFLWIGTYGGGLNKFNVSNGTFKRYNTSNGLLNDVVYGIAIDNEGFVWFSSNAGLSKLNSSTDEFKHFGLDYGIQSEEFNAGAYFKSKDGELFFGGINGLNAFYPNTISQTTSTAKLVFTDFSLLDEKNGSTPDKLLEKHISRLDTIKLIYNQNNFSIKFSELNYANNVDNSYEYQLEGLSDIWHSLEKKQAITFGNLNPGNYKLIVRIVNDTTKSISIYIIISPPFWKTNLAYFIYALLLIVVVIMVYKYQKKTQRIKQQFELKIKKLENDINLSTQLHQNHNINNVPLKQINAVSIHEKFLQRAVEIVEANIENSNFDVHEFADEMFMSRSQLHRKIKTNTGYSTTKFIRLIRLKRAAQLLAQNSATVSEIAYKVGFDNVGYFSKCFNETFGKPPSQYNG